jgi:pimeloyl-ACP methyl ester carboxylesterase
MTSLAVAVSILVSGLPVGKSSFTLAHATEPLKVFTYKPARYAGGPLVLVCHGTLRNAEEYRDHAVAMADRLNVLVAAPLFDAERFPSWRYHRGGVLDAQGKAADRSTWTYNRLNQIVDEIRGMEGKPRLPFALIGHSAGGQFLVRMCAFYDSGAFSIVAANPGSELFPTTEQKFGYGYGGLPDSLANERTMRQYLAQPLTLYLGTDDNGPDEYFDGSPEAMVQGAGRLQRGHAVFDFAKKLAADKSWKFNWRLVEALQIPHNHDLMFNHPKFGDVLFRRIGK